MVAEEKNKQYLPDLLKALEDIDAGREPKPIGVMYLDLLVTSYKSGTSRRQVIISFTKWMHGFNITNVEADMKYLQGEVSEANDALTGSSADDFVYELADIAIYCYGIAQMSGRDLDTYIDNKMRFNLDRRYTKQSVPSEGYVGASLPVQQEGR